MNEVQLQQLVKEATVPNPSGQLRTYKELGEKYSRHEYTIGLNLRKQGIYRLPEVAEYDPPINEQAFTLAMVLTDYQATLVNLGGQGNHPFVKVWTYHNDERHKRLLDIVYSEVGSPGNDKQMPYYHLHPETFGYLLDPN